MSFPKFPKFHKMTVDDKNTYLKYYEKLDEPCSDFTIDDVLVWLDYNDDLEVSDLHGNLIIRFTNILDEQTLYYSLLGTEKLKATLDELFPHIRSHPSKVKLKYIPEQIAKAIQSLNYPNIEIKEDLDNRDYVYKIDELVMAKGTVYRGLRKKINNFTTDNKNISFKHFDLRRKEDRDVISYNVHKWSKRGDYLKNDPEKWEYSAIKRHLKLANHLPAYAFGTYVEDSLVSIVIYNRPPQRDWIIANHIKCDYNYRAVFGYSTYSLAIVAQKLGIKWLNMQQDLGKEGLRRLKTLFHPQKFIRCYTISLREGTKAQ